MSLEPDARVILEELISVLVKKHKDYGPYNIALAPGGPMNGLRVRMYDKLARINNLFENQNDTPNYESLEDSFIDIANYAIIAILVQRGQWEGIDKNEAHSSVVRSSDPVSRSQSTEGYR